MFLGRDGLISGWLCPGLPSCIPGAEVLERSLVSNPGFTAANVRLGWSRILRLQTKKGCSPIPLLQSETHTHTHNIQICVLTYSFVLTFSLFQIK